MNRVEIRLFGSLTILWDGQRTASLQGRKCRDLLTYLILRHDVPHAREHLAALFWGDRDDAHARRCFNTALWRLQAALGGKGGPASRWLRIDAQTVSFCPDATVYVDSIDFETRCALADGWPAAEAEQQAAMRRQAVELYRGDLLADCYEEWCLADRERLQRLYVRTLRRLVQYHRQRGELDAAIEDARRILACDPLREEVHRDLIRLYADAGQPAAAIQQYRACFEVLKRELGTAPMRETSLLVQRIMRDQVEERRAAEIAPAVPVLERVAGESHAQSLDMLAQLCSQLRDLAASLETVAARLSPPRPTLVHGGRPALPDPAHRQVLTEITTRLEPVAAVLKHASFEAWATPRMGNIAQR